MRVVPRLKVAAKESIVLLALAVVLTAGWWARNPDRLPLVAEPAQYELELEAPLLTVVNALAAYEEGVQLFVDTRAGSNPETVPGAMFIGEDTFDDDLNAYFDFMSPEDQIILFGDGDLAQASNIAGRLKARGYTEISILKGGLAAWKKAGGATSTAGRRSNP